MKTQEWTYIDKSAWPERGAWDSESDKVQWTDEATGLPCLVVRGGHHGALCGYVGVTKAHPYFDMEYWLIEETLDVHGSLTFSDRCSPHADNPERGICHVVEAGEDGDVWWLGFDCNHSGDFAPGYESMWNHGGSYCSLAYVKSQCRSLAGQLASVADADEVAS